MFFSRRGPGRITAGEAHRLLRDGTAVLIDVREADEFLATAVLGAWDGRRLATKVSPGTLQRVFGGVLLAVAVTMGATAVL